MVVHPEPEVEGVGHRMQQGEEEEAGLHLELEVEGA